MYLCFHDHLRRSEIFIFKTKKYVGISDFFTIFSLMNCISEVESDICIFINKDGKFLKKL